MLEFVKTIVGNYCYVKLEPFMVSHTLAYLNIAQLRAVPDTPHYSCIYI